jgi:hypothetical protein
MKKKSKTYMVEVKSERGYHGEWLEAILEPVNREEALRIKDKFKKDNVWYGYRIVPCDKSSITIIGRVGSFILGA